MNREARDALQRSSMAQAGLEKLVTFYAKDPAAQVLSSQFYAIIAVFIHFILRRAAQSSNSTKRQPRTSGSPLALQRLKRR